MRRSSQPSKPSPFTTMSWDATSARASAGASAAKTGDVVITADTGGTITLQDGWEYLEPGKIESITPDQGQVGTRIVIKGSRLLAGGVSLATLELAGISAADITSVSDDTIEAIAAAGPGDTVLIAGKGHETYQVLKDSVVPFDDRLEASRALSAKEAGWLHR